MSATASGAAKLDLAIGGIGEGFSKASGGISAFGAALAGTGIGLALKAADAVVSVFGNLKGSVIDTNAALESSKQGWAIMLGGADAAEQQIQTLYKFAADTPFEFGEVDKASRLLETFGGRALDTSKNLTLVGDIAAATDQPFSEVATWVGRMYSAMQNGQPFGEAAARLQEMGALSGEARTQLERLQKEGASGDVLWATFNGTMGRFSGTMKAQAGTWNGLMSTVQDTINQLAATAGKPIFAFAQQGLSRFAAALADPRVAAFAQLIADKLTVALDQVGRVIAAAWPPLQRFLGGIVSAGRAVLDAARAFLTGQTNLGQFIGGLEIMARTIVGNLAGALGQLAGVVGPALGAFGGAVVGFLQGLLPQIVGQLQSWGLRFGGWVLDTAWPVVREQLATLGARLADWLTGTAAPFIADKATALGEALGGWVTGTALPLLAAQLPVWLAALADFLTGTVLPWATTTFKDLAERWYGWLLNDALPNLLRALPQWLLAIDTWIATVALPVIVRGMAQLGRAVVDWLGDAVPRLVAALPQVSNAISNWLTFEAIPAVAGAFKTLGGAMVDGIVQGLKEAWPRVRDALLNLAKNLPGPVQDALGIGSPSRVFADRVGAPIAQGIAAGILAERPALDKLLGSLVDVPPVPGGARAAGAAGGVAAGAAGAWGGGVSVTLNIAAPNLTDLGDPAQQRAFAAAAGDAARRAWGEIVRGGLAGVP